MIRKLCVFLFISGFFSFAKTDSQYVDAMAREHKNDSPVANSASKKPPSDEVDTALVSYANVDGQAIAGYLAWPKGKAEGLPSLIVIHEWWGLNENIKAMTRRLAGEGFLALAVDLYGGNTAQKPEDARKFMQNVSDNPEPAKNNLRQARQYLVNKKAGRIGVIGWCFGGAWSLKTALMFPQSLDAAVIYYGHLITDKEKLKTLEVPVLGHFGEKDQGIPLENVKEFQSILIALNKDAIIHVYDNAGHAFANPSGKRYVQEAAEKSWVRTLDFLDKHLKP